MKFFTALLLAVQFSAPVFAQSGWDSFIFEGGRSANSIHTITEDTDGNIWVGTSEKLHWFDGTEWQSFDEILDRTDYYVRDIAFSPTDEMWIIVSEWGILKYSEDTWTVVKEGIFGIIEFDSHGNLWTRTSPDATLARYDGETWITYSYNSDRWIYYVYDIATDDSGDIWIGEVGLYHTHVDSLDSWTHYTTEDGLICEGANEVDIGENDDLWILTGDGMSYFDGTFFTDITDEDGPMSPTGFIGMATDINGTLWVKHSKYNLCAYVDGEWETNFYEPADFVHYYLRDMFVDSQNRLWIGTNGGLFRHQLSPITVVENGTDTPESFTLSPPTPNPFNPVTTITYSLTESSPVTLAVYNVSGQKVATLFDERQAAGMHSATFDGTGLASGLYFARIEAGGMVQTEKMVLMK